MGGLTIKEKRAVEMFKSRLVEKFPGRLESVSLFGSKARGEAREDSDIDLLVVLNKSNWEDRERVISLANDLWLKEGVDLSPKVYSLQQMLEMERRRNIFWQTIRPDLVIV